MDAKESCGGWKRGAGHDAEWAFEGEPNAFWASRGDGEDSVNKSGA